MRWVLAAAFVSAALAAGCGGDTGGNQGDAGAPGFVAPLNLADCEDWKGATIEERFATIGQIKEFTGGPVAGGEATGSTLSDERAYDLFENYCANEFARGFKLYKLYGRAAGFQDVEVPESTQEPTASDAN